MRCFFAIELPEVVKSEVLLLTKKYPGIQYSKPSNMHLTLKFMGDVGDVNSLINAVKGVKSDNFNVRLEGVGAFPNKEFIRVLWIGVDEGRGELNFLSEKINAVTEDFRKNDYSNFIPHLTIARCNNDCDKNILIEDFESSIFKVNEFVLMKSEFTSDGVRHSVIHRFRLI